MEKKIYVLYDKLDGEVICAFDSKVKAEENAFDAGVQFKEITLYAAEEN